MKNKDLTLIELMIIVAIIGILASIAIPNFMRFKCRTEGNRLGLNEETVREVCYDGEIDQDQKYALLKKKVEIKNHNKKTEILKKASFDPQEQKQNDKNEIDGLRNEIETLKRKLNPSSTTKESWKN